MAKYFQFKKSQIVQKQYGNGRRALIIEPAVAHLTVNLPDVDIADDEVAIKNYSENEGVLGDLMAMDVVSPPMRFVQSGFTRIPICKFLGLD